MPPARARTSTQAHAASTPTLDAWRAYADSGPAADLLAVPTEPQVADLAQLRRRWPADVVAVAVEAARARAKARAKLHRELADRVLADAGGVESASSWEAARHKAARFASHATHADNHASGVLDLCCGIGGDAYALATAGLSVVAVDADATRAWMASRNARCESAVGDVGSPAWLERIDGARVHLDPSRRGGGRRHHRYEDYAPGPATIAAITARARAACVKLGPGVDFAALPQPEASEVELLSERGGLTQALLWTGTLRTTPAWHRRATLLPAGASFHAPPQPAADAVGWDPEAPTPATILEPDPSLERAGLLGPFAREHGLGLVHPAVGLLACAPGLGDPPPDARPWVAAYDVLEVMPWREKRVRAALRALDAGLVAVKTRGKLVDTDALQKSLRGAGPNALSVFVLRFGSARRAIIARRRPG